MLPRKIDEQSTIIWQYYRKFLKDILDEKRYSSKTYQVFGYVLQIIVCSFVLFAMIFQTCYSIYIRYKFWCWLQSHLQQDLTILKLVSWSNSNAIVLDWEVHISCQSNQTQCCHHCNISSKGAVLPFTNLRGFPLCYILRHNISIVKDLMCQNLATYKLVAKVVCLADYTGQQQILNRDSGEFISMDFWCRFQKGFYFYSCTSSFWDFSVFIILIQLLFLSI